MITYTAPPRRPKRPPRTELNPGRIAAAFEGNAEAKALTSAERQYVVCYLAVVENLSDPEIADLLHWGPAHNVTRFRAHWNIPSGLRLARQAPIRMDQVANAIAGRVAMADLRTRELRTVVRHLATRLHMTDPRIALHLNWQPDLPLAIRAQRVQCYRNRWDIPAAAKPRPADNRELVNDAWATRSAS